MQLLFPQEVEVWYVIPALRRELATELKRFGMQQSDIADKLGLTKAAVSQYLSGKRAAQLKFEGAMKEHIKKSAKRIQKGAAMVPEINSLIAEVWKTDLICKLHKTQADIPKQCDWCKHR